MKKDKTIIGLVLVSLFFMFGTFTLYRNYGPYFAEIRQAYQDKDALNLDNELTESELADLFTSHEYIKDPVDADYIAKWIKRRYNEGGALANLGALNLNANKMVAVDAQANGGSQLHERLAMSRRSLGFVDSTALKHHLTVNPGDSVIEVTVFMKDTVGGWRGLINRVRQENKIPVAGVPVRLTEYKLKERNNYDATPDRFIASDSVIGWAVTNASGIAVLPVKAGGSYSVVPVRDGYEYGREKGTVNGEITDKTTSFAFEEKPHKITPLDPMTYNRIKEDRALTVRTPEQWKDNLIMAVIIFLLSWWGGFFVIKRIDRKLGKQSDGLMLIALMTMTGISLLAMFAIADPLVDRMMGLDMAWGVFYGVLALVAMSSVNYVKFYRSESRIQGGVLQFDFLAQGINWLAKPFADKLQSLKQKRKPGGGLMALVKTVGYFLGMLLAVLLLPVDIIRWLLKKCGLSSDRIKQTFSMVSWPQGIGYMLVALMLVVLLRIFGSGPEGSGARVNLGPLQPSEISKYLVVVFMAAFFATNAEKIRGYATRIDDLILKLKFQARTIIIMVLCLGLLLGCYVLLISDMGPALVLIVTFLFIYSIARGDFLQLILGVITFVLTMMFASWVNNTPTTMAMFALLWLAAWLAYGWLKDKRIYESAIIMNLLFLVFIQAGSWLTAMGAESEGLRLNNRVEAAWSGVWNNEVPGGDQVAQGLWSLATGGLFGQGLGRGNANLVPAFHTDMIFLSIGEVMGWVTLVLILVCLALMLHRSMLLARRSGHPFLFYLVSGIAIVIGVQFFVIVLGSTGLIPLTGVAVPLLSYGKSSLIMNLAAFGIVISCSRIHAGKNQEKQIRKYDEVIASSSLTFILMSVFLGCTLLYYQFVQRDSTLIRPAYVCDKDGNRLQEYNPRIMLLVNKLNAGNIYDRNGVLLATSDPAALTENLDQLVLCGLDRKKLSELSHERMKRYYPFAEDLFFMLGDLNTKVLWGSNDSYPYGYLAEKRHLSHLRGFDNLLTDDQKVVDTVTAKQHVYNRFLPAERTKKTLHFTHYNYEELLPMLKSGIKSGKVKKWNEQRNKRDLTLTIDANLQHLMQQQMAAVIKDDGFLKGQQRLRASVVVLDVNTGDLLTSSCYPLPDQDIISQTGGVYNDNGEMFQAYTERDLGLTYQTQPGSTAKVMSALAGFMKLGDEAAKAHYFVYGDERVHEGVEPSDNVNIHDAIVRSSNNFFVHFVNDQDLHPQLDSIYRMAGIRLHIEEHESLTPYYFDMDPSFSYGAEMESLRVKSVNKYTNYMNNRRIKHQKFNWVETGHAWGQQNIYATPLNMARVVSMVANNGKFVPTRYVLKYGTGKKAKETHPADAVSMVSNTRYLYSYMQDESDSHRKYPLPGARGNQTRMGGKTGTPMRAFGSAKKLKDDAWYICFINSNKQHGPLAIAVRLERSGVGSKKAVEFVAKAVVPALNNAGYQLQ